MWFKYKTIKEKYISCFHYDCFMETWVIGTYDVEVYYFHDFYRDL